MSGNLLDMIFPMSGIKRSTGVMGGSQSLQKMAKKADAETEALRMAALIMCNGDRVAATTAAMHPSEPLLEMAAVCFEVLQTDQ